MTSAELIAWKVTDGTVRLAGTELEFLLVKNAGDTDGALATREQYEKFLVSYAHAHASGPILRYSRTIGTIADLTCVPKLNASV